jgi:glycosyltransferase involved in cell wall biosynthesis
VSKGRRILICNERFLARYGHDRTLVLLGRELASRGHHVAFACLRCERRVLAAISDDINQIALADDLEFAEIDRRTAETIEAGWVRNRPDVLVSGGWPFFELAARSAAHGIPSLFIDAGAVPHDGYREPSLSIQRELRRLRKRTLPFIDRILPNSDFTRDSQTLPDRGYEDGVTTVHLGADHLGMGFNPDEIDEDAEQILLARLDGLCRAGSNLILALGRFEPEGYKNSSMIFEVFSRIREQVPGTHLLILAGPVAVTVPVELAEHTICLRTVSDAALQQIMRLCTLGVTMSLWEGFNLPLAEMQLIGRPVLAFNVAAHPEVVADPWFLCGSAAEMARKGVRLLTQGLPPVIVRCKRLERVRERLQWADTLARWVAEIEELAERPILRTRPSRRLVLIDVTNSGSDPSNSGVINVTRQLARRLLDDSELFVLLAIWDRAAGGYALPTASQRSFLESYAGPTDRLGRAIEQLGHYVSLESVIEGVDPGCGRPPVLLFTEVALDGSPRQRVAWGRARGFRLAVVLHDMLPIYEAKYAPREIVEAFPEYVEAVVQADAIWPNSSFTLRQFERYCNEHDVTMPPHREAVPLPGQLGEAPRSTDCAPATEETRVLCVSGIEPRKNHRVLVEAFERLKLRRRDLALRLILIGCEYPGAETLAEWLRELARRDDRIEWRTRVPQPELEAEFADATFTVYPSLVEGFGLPIMESLWMGRPCICHEAGVMAELATGGGCLTVDVTEPIELSVAMEKLCSDPALIDALRRQAGMREITTWAAYGGSIASRLKDL